MKNNAILRIILWSIVLVVLVGILLLFSVGTSITTSSQVLSSNFTASAAEVQSLSIDWAAGSIAIVPGDGETITVEESGAFSEKNAMSCTLSAGTLTIRSHKSFTILGSSPIKDLTITVPAGWECGTLSVDAASADLTVKELTIHAVDLDTASGENLFQNCAVGKLDIDTASGQVRFSGTLSHMEADAASADIIAELDNTPDTIDVDSASGSLELTLPEDAGYTVTMDGMSSSYSSEFEQLSVGAHTGKSHHIHGDGRCQITVDAMSGKVAIHKK